MPSRRKLSGLIEQTSDVLVHNMKASLGTARRVSLTTDCWSGKNSVDNFLGVTVSFQEGTTRERKSYNIGKFIVRRYSVSEFDLYLACRVFNEKHSGENLSKKLLEVLHEYEIAGKSWYLVTDGAKNMEKGISLLFVVSA